MKSTARLRVLHALTDAGSRGCTTAELARPDCGGVRFGGRLKELRDEGHHIDGHRVGPGSFRYFLTRAGDPPPAEVDREPVLPVHPAGTPRPRWEAAQGAPMMSVRDLDGEWSDEPLSAEVAAALKGPSLVDAVARLEKAAA